MIRFDCPLCGKVLKSAEDQAGRAVACPRCGERCLVPAGGNAEPAEFPAEPDEAPGLLPSLLSGLSSPARCALGLLAVAVVLGLALALLHPLLAAVPACSFVVACVILHGRSTGCPSCRKWWSRAMVGTEFLDREVFERGGSTFARSRSRTTYACGDCGHRWSEDEEEEFPAKAPGDLLRREERVHTSRKASD
jgi:DNA-directed RNA polymerase subunit RPC12/RpoP